jgi:hypothetical protein
MGTSNHLGATKWPILLGKNYEFWSLGMRSFLQAHECWDPMDLGYVELDTADLASINNQERVSHAEQRKIESKEKFWI